MSDELNLAHAALVDSSRIGLATTVQVATFALSAMIASGLKPNPMRLLQSSAGGRARLRSTPATKRPSGDALPTNQLIAWAERRLSPTPSCSSRPCPFPPARRRGSTAAPRTIENAMLDHVTLRTRDLEGAKAFFETVLGLEVGYRPALSFPGYWLYADGEPIVHLIRGQGSPVDQAGEAIDHIAFRLDDHEAMRRKLDRLSIPYSRMDLPELGERRLFIRTPTGVLLELVFLDGNAESATSPDQEQNHAQ